MGFSVTVSSLIPRRSQLATPACRRGAAHSAFPPRSQWCDCDVLMFVCFLGLVLLFYIWVSRATLYFFRKIAVHHSCVITVFFLFVSCSFSLSVVPVQVWSSAVWSFRRMTTDLGWRLVGTIQSSCSLSKKARRLSKLSCCSGADWVRLGKFK